MAEPVKVLLVSGTVGVGKSTIAAEINELLAEEEIPNAAIDLDALYAQWPPDSKWNSNLLFENLASIWPNYRKRGVTHLVLAHVLEDLADLDRYRAAVPGAVMTICRLVAPEEVRLSRLNDRMYPGASLDWHLNRTIELDAVLSEKAYEDFTVENDGRTVREVALEVVRRANWL